MPHLLTIQLFCFTLQVFKALHDAAITDIQDYSKPNYSKDSKKWHKLSEINYYVIALFVAYLTQWIYIVPMLLIRGAFFSPLYQIFRTEKKGIFYLSENDFVTKLFGKYGGVVQFVAGTILLAIADAAIFKFI